MQCVINGMRAMAIDLKYLGYRVYRSKSADIDPFRYKQGEWDYCFYVLNNGVLYMVSTDYGVIYTSVYRFDSNGISERIQDDNPWDVVHGKMKPLITTEVLQKIFGKPSFSTKDVGIIRKHNRLRTKIYRYA